MNLTQLNVLLTAFLERFCLLLKLDNFMNLEVDEEDDDAEVNTGSRSRDEISFLVENEKSGSHDRGFGGAGKVFNFFFFKFRL
jgi:hypothetical protein